MQIIFLTPIDHVLLMYNHLMKMLLVARCLVPVIEHIEVAMVDLVVVRLLWFWISV